jgi:hypothetical protein
MTFFTITYTLTTFFKLYLGYDVFIFCHGLCVASYEARDGVGVCSTFGVVPDHLQSIVNSTLTNGLGYYGIDLIELEVTPMGASTIQCIERQDFFNHKILCTLAIWTQWF